MGRPKKSKVYLAGPWFDEVALTIHRTVKNILKNIKGIECYFPDESECVSPAGVWNDNLNHIEKAEYVLALIDVKDVGTAWELGMAYQLKKKVFLVGIDEDSFKTRTNLMLAFCGPCITIGNLEKMLTGQEYKLAHIDREWGNIE